MNRILEGLDPSKGAKSLFLFLIVFSLLYGFGVFGYSEFSLLYENPFELLPQKKQWLHESPIQYFVGFIFFQTTTSLNAFIFTQFIAFIYLVASIYSFTVVYQINTKALIYTLALSPFFLVLVSWFGKPDPFLIGSLFAIIAVQKVFAPASFIFICISVFAHPQITVIHLFLCIVLGQLRPSSILALSYLMAFALYALYLSEIGHFAGRLEYIETHILNIIATQVRQPFFSLFCSFGWLWFVILNQRHLLPKKFYFALSLTFIITIITLDHTRVFVLLNIPLLIYIIQNLDVVSSVRKITVFVPTVLLMLFQFQKIPGGAIVDSTWSWYWLNDFVTFMGF